jgi:hypothetical protein
LPLLKVLADAFRRINKESVVNGDTQGGDEAICLRGHADDGDQLSIFLIGRTFRASTGRVRMNAVGTTMGDRNCDVEHFLDLGLKHPRRHDLFDTLPGPVECRRVVRQRAPKLLTKSAAASYECHRR